jgi:adenylate kinase
MIDEDLGITQRAVRDRRALVVVAGLPGAGKGTQCAQIARDLHAAHFSIGAALRDDADRRTPLGLQAHAFLETGRLVPDRLVLELIDARLARERAPLVLLDGFPRTLGQAEALERAQPGAVSLAVLLAVPLATVTERLRSRGRADDDESALRERLASFERDTKPMLAWYERHRSLIVVDADRPRRDVTLAVEALLARSLMTLPYPAKDAHNQRPGSRSYGNQHRLGISTP